jgi:hypothetical protein
MTAAERAELDAVLSAKARTEVSLSVRLGDADPVPARVHLHGQTSLNCARKSFVVDLAGSAWRHLMPGVASDELLLVAMCYDRGYFQQFVANTLAADLGLFPPGFRFVELVIDGTSAGVYLMLERTEEALVLRQSRPQVVVRRRFDPDGNPAEVLLPDGAGIDAPRLSSYRELATLGTQWAGDALAEELGARIDLDPYLRWIALMSLLGNGDWVDEVFFHATETVRDGARADFYRVMAWDMDDLFSPCHHNGVVAMPDPWGLLFCAEGNLEKSVLGDPILYDRFVDVLDELVTAGLTAEVFDAAVDEAAAALLPWFDRPEICAAMVELLALDPNAATPAVARADIVAFMDEARAQYQARADLLRSRIAAYRAAGGPP